MKIEEYILMKIEEYKRLHELILEELWNKIKNRIDAEITDMNVGINDKLEMVVPVSFDREIKEEEYEYLESLGFEMVIKDAQVQNGWIMFEKRHSLYS